MANEQRCTDLGANCIASEPLNTSAYTYSSPWCNPADTTGSDKQMALAGAAAGQMIENSNGVNMAGTWTFPSSGALFTALPNISPNVNFVLQGTPEPSSVNFLGHAFSSSNPTARRSMRWYQYFSPTWELTGGACLNRGKIFELGNEADPLVFTSDGDHQIYGWNGSSWNISPYDCCTGGPGSQSFAMDTSPMGGKWWRFELVVRNALPTGSVTIIELWRRNVTDNGANIKVLDTADTSFGPGSPSWGSTQATTLKPNARLDVFKLAPWGNGTCSGFVAFTHLLAAAWDTDAGQMIGAATEIEGGAAGSGGNLIVAAQASVNFTTATGPQTVYWTESFPNASYGARGWYGVSSVGSGIDAGMGHWTWDIGDSGANEGYPSNRLLNSNTTPTMTVTSSTIYMSFDFKVGTNWNNGDLPHILGFMTNGETIADPINGLNEWDGPSVATGYYSFQTVGLKAAVYFADGERVFDDAGATYPHNNATPSLLGTTGVHAAFGGNGFQTGYSTAFYSAGQNAHRFDSVSNVFTPGVLHHVEVYFAMNSFSGGADVGDGIAKVWVDGVLVINRTNLYLRTPGYEAQKFGRMIFTPNFPTPVTAAQEMWMDNLIVADQPPSSAVAAVGLSSSHMRSRR